MLKRNLLFLGLSLSLLPGISSACPEFLDHSMRKLASKETINFCESFQGKALLIVNTASYCGYTGQFSELELLHQQYAPRGLVVLGFSSDDFFQEDNDEGDAAEVCFEKYNVSFPVIATSSVRGANANLVFRGLGESRGYPSWNFNKYLVSPDGRVEAHFSSNVSPTSERIKQAIEAVLPAQST